MGTQYLILIWVPEGGHLQETVSKITLGIDKSGIQVPGALPNKVGQRVGGPWWGKGVFHFVPSLEGCPDMAECNLKWQGLPTGYYWVTKDQYLTFLGTWGSHMWTTRILGTLRTWKWDISSVLSSLPSFPVPFPQFWDFTGAWSPLHMLSTLLQRYLHDSLCFWSFVWLPSARF